MAEFDWYKLLQVAQDADVEVISAAFRALSKKFHPDISGDAATLAQQQLIGEAYAVLSDPHKRAVYDTTRLARLVPERVRNSPTPHPPAEGNAAPTRPIEQAAAAPPQTEQPGQPRARVDPAPGNTQTVRQRQADERVRNEREAEVEQMRWRAYHAGQQQQVELAAQRMARQAAHDRRRNLALLIIGALILLVAVAVVVRLTLLYSQQ